MKDRTLISFDYAIKYLLKDKQDYEIVEGFISAVREDFKSPYMKKVAQRLNVLKMSHTEREAYDHYINRSLKERDYLVAAEDRGLEKGLRKGEEIGLEKGKALGLEEGKALGLEKGKAQGGEERARAIALNLLKAKLSAPAIAAATGLSLEAIECISSDLI